MFKQIPPKMWRTMALSARHTMTVSKLQKTGQQCPVCQNNLWHDGHGIFCNYCTTRREIRLRKQNGTLDPAAFTLNLQPEDTPDE